MRRDGSHVMLVRVQWDCGFQDLGTTHALFKAGKPMKDNRSLSAALVANGGGNAEARSSNRDNPVSGTPCIIQVVMTSALTLQCSRWRSERPAKVSG